MLQLALGLILLFFPFSLLFVFENKRRFFIFILFWLLVFHTFLGFFTQLFRVFEYKIVALFTFLSDLIILVLIIFKIKKVKFDLKTFSSSFLNKIDWVLVGVVFISFLTLWQVHYNYTGKINFATDIVPTYHEVKNFRYPYPYFSDEWYSVALIKYAISSKSLPWWDPINNLPFWNIQVFFHTLLSEIVVLLKMNPLLHYSLLSLFFNLLIILLIYFYFRENNFTPLTAGISSLFILYLTCGATLPGIWHLIPIHLGIIFSLFSIYFLNLNFILYAIFSLLLVFLFYPPLSLFIFFGFLVFWIEKSIKEKGNFLKILIYSLVLFLIIFPFAFKILMFSPLAKFVKYLISRAFFVSFNAPFFIQIKFYQVIPLPVIVFSLFGIFILAKNKRWFLATFLLGVGFWFWYSFSLKRFLIEYERVVFLVQILSVIVSGFGINWLESFLREKIKKTSFNFDILKVGEFAVIFLFFVLISSYTQREGWLKVCLIDKENKLIHLPKAPANYYLTEDDLRIFKDIKEKRFLSLPWKGTVIGVATDNFPLLAKEGTLSAGDSKILYDFLEGNCEKKRKIAKSLKIDYIYLYQFECPEFEKISQSQENLVLYKAN